MAIVCGVIIGGIVGALAGTGVALWMVALYGSGLGGVMAVLQGGGLIAGCVVGGLMASRRKGY